MENNSTEIFTEINTTIIFEIVLVIITSYLIIWSLTFFLTWVSERMGQHRITIKMVIPLLKFSVYGLTVYFILVSILKLNLEQFLLFGAFFGAAIGFGLKDMFEGVIGGIIITLEKPYQVGDKIKLGEYYGEVNDIGLRSTKLVTPDDSLVSVPNYLIFTQSVSSSNSGKPEMMVVIDLFIDSNSDSVLAMKILKEATVTSKYVYISKKHPFTVLLKDYPFYKRIRAKAYVNDLRYEFEFESDVTRRAWIEFSKRDIKAPSFNIIEKGTET